MSSTLKGILFTLIFFLGHSDIFGYNNNLFEHIRNLDSSQAGNGATFTCGGLSFSLIWVRNGVFLFDCHSRNIEGFPDPNGCAVPLEFRLMRSLNNFIKRFYRVNVPNSFILQYDIRYIKVKIPTESISNIQAVLNRQRNTNYYFQPKNKNNDIDFEIDCQCY